MVQNLIKYEHEEKNETNGENKEEEEIKYYDTILETIEEGFTSENYDTSNLDKGEDEVIETEKITITFTTSQNQKNDINKNISSINLGECEILLKNYYNISINETLYMKKLDIVQEGMKTKKVEYDVYSKLSGKNLIKLNLTVCKNSKVSISLPFELMESLDIFNSSSGYYNDICYTTTSDDGTDISIKDRKNEYVNGNKVICQDDCDFTNYDYDTLKAKCSCKVKESSSSFIDININKTKILENIKEIKNFANFKFLICHKKLFTKKGLLNNIGSYLILVIILTHIINIFIFYIKQLSLINKIINNITFGITNYILIKSDKKELNNDNMCYNNW